MRSNGGLLFGACTIASGFSGVFCDQGYWQRAIASRPQSTTTAYTLGGLSWFAIPWGQCMGDGCITFKLIGDVAFGSTMGLGAAALELSPDFPTFPYPLSAAQQSAGLVAPAAAATLLGASGAGLLVVIVFTAATSAASAELSQYTFPALDHDNLKPKLISLKSQYARWWCTTSSELTGDH